MLNPSRGEANCTSDLIEAAFDSSVLLNTPPILKMLNGRSVNYLLASQMDDLSWVTENEEITNTEIHAYDNLRQRAQRISLLHF